MLLVLKQCTLTHNSNECELQETFNTFTKDDRKRAIHLPMCFLNWLAQKEDPNQEGLRFLN